MELRFLRSSPLCLLLSRRAMGKATSARGPFEAFLVSSPSDGLSRGVEFSSSTPGPSRVVVLEGGEVEDAAREEEVEIPLPSAGASHSFLDSDSGFLCTVLACKDAQSLLPE